MGAFVKACVFLLLASLPTVAVAGTVTEEEARQVAGNWVRLVVERDGHWAGVKNPATGAVTRLEGHERTLGYYVSVEPQGYVVVSLLKGFAPVKAYSTTRRLDPEAGKGLVALIKDDTEGKLAFLARRYGPLESVGQPDISRHAGGESLKAWAYLLEDAGVTMDGRQAFTGSESQKAGPLLETSWHQDPPYNDDYPDGGCSWPGQGNFNTNYLTGCTVTAAAQVMKYFAWPASYDWPGMLREYIYNHAAGRFEDQSGRPASQQNIDAVAELMRDIDDTLTTNPLSDCGFRGHSLCSSVLDNARDALEEHFSYADPGDDEPWCEERVYYGSRWWGIIKDEIDGNSPVLYGIANEGIFYPDFGHAIVVDGYDNLLGLEQVHANYGWGPGGDNTWYTLDNWECNGYECLEAKEQLIRQIYPRNALCGSYSGRLAKWTEGSGPHSYLVCDVSAGDLVVEGGARVQFLPGVSMRSVSGSVRMSGGEAPSVTRLYSEGILSRGIALAGGGTMTLFPGGGLSLQPVGAPKYLQVASATGSQVTLSWEAGYGEISGYEVERKTASGGYAALATVALTAYVDSAVMPSTPYCYRVRSVRDDGASSEARERCVTTGI